MQVKVINQVTGLPGPKFIKTKRVKEAIANSITAFARIAKPRSLPLLDLVDEPRSPGFLIQRKVMLAVQE
jgi:hypothetical protein